MAGTVKYVEIISHQIIAISMPAYQQLASFFIGQMPSCQQISNCQSAESKTLYSN